MPTIAQVAKLYGQRRLANLKSGSATAGSLDLLVRPLGDRSIDEVTQEALVEVLHGIAVEAPVHANRILAYGRSFFGWAVEQGYVEFNPMHGLPPFTAEVVRGHQLSFDEVLRIWESAGLLGWPFAQAFRLLILTAAKREQIGGLCLDHLRSSPTGDGGLIWCPPGEVSESDEQIQIALPPLAQTILREAMDGRKDGATYVLSRTGKSAIDGWAKAKKRLDGHICSTPHGATFARWQIQDLRLSFPALAVEHAGVEPIIAEACLMRSSRFTSPRDKEWMRSEQMAERRSDALRCWAAALENHLPFEASTGEPAGRS